MEQLNEMKIHEMKIHELRDKAKEYAIVGRWHMKKKNLQNSIREAIDKEKEGVLPCHKTRCELTKEAKDLGIVGVGTLNKIGLRKEIEERKKRGKDEVVICGHENDFLSCPACSSKKLCIHGRGRYFCKDCGGSQICIHNKKLFNCFPCAEEKRKEKRSRWCDRKEEAQVIDVREREEKSDPKKRDHIVVDWITDDESEAEEGDNSCLIDDYDNVYDLIADLNAKDV